MSGSKPKREARSQAEAFVAHVYENDYEAIQKLVQQYPNTETGGDLFGLWKDERTVIIQQFIGPGKKCERTPTSFHQDIEYLHKVGSLITTEEGLCNVGEWHSHHQIGMPEPSEADCRTVFNNMPNLGLERFVLFIASIESTGSSGKKRTHDVKLDHIKLRPFLFLGSTQKIVKGEIEIIRKSENPHRLNSRARNEIEAGAESLPDNRGGKRHDDQQRTRREQDTRKNRDGKGDQTQRRDGCNNENRSPNTGSAAPRSRDFQSLPTFPTAQMNSPLHSGTSQAWGPGTQANVAQTTSAPNSLRQVWDASSYSGTVQGQGRGIHGNMPPTDDAYSSPRSPQRASDAQQTSQRSAMGNGQGNIPCQSHATPRTNQAKKKDHRQISVSNMSSGGFF